MAFRRLVVLGPPVIASLLSLAACGSDEGTAASASPDGGTAQGTSSSSGGSTSSSSSGGNTPNPNFPAAEGDPCRGTALPERAFHAAGTCARLIANDGVNGLRQISFMPSGDILGTTNGGKILLFRDANKDGVYAKSEITTWGDTGGNGNNAHIDVAGGFVYAGSVDGVKRFAWDPTAPKAGAAQDVVINQPGGGHSKHTAHVYDGFLYVGSGSSGNQSHDDQVKGQYDGKRSLIRRFELAKFKAGTPFDWSKDGENVSLGLRNPNGFARNEATGKIYAVVNGLDQQKYGGVDVHHDNPGEQISEIAAGKNYGYPFCFTAQRIVATDAVVAPGTQLTAVFAGATGNDDAWCAANSAKPTTFVQAHSAPLDIAFFDKQPTGALPEKWRGGAFIALHGSWNRDVATGYKVVWQPFNADGTSPLPTSTKDATNFPHEIVFGGADKGTPKDGPWQWTTDGATDTPRPSGVAISPVDGALYIATDTPGALYRVGLTR